MPNQRALANALKSRFIVYGFELLKAHQTAGASESNKRILQVRRALHIRRHNKTTGKP
jgi:hypothetical protein